MIVYHGSLEKIETPEIRVPNRALDYGEGFYTTTSYKQAEDWVRRKLDKDCPTGYVNTYELDDSAEITFFAGDCKSDTISPMSSSRLLMLQSVSIWLSPT